MVREEVVGKGVRDPLVIAAMSKVPRHLFVPEALEGDAYGVSALPIGLGQTISAPHMVALMTEALRLTGGERILEVGTGSGYQTAVLAHIAPRIVTVERVAELARRAQALLASQGREGVVVKMGDGSRGYPEAAPYDRILVTAAAPSVPAALRAQLAEGGILVAPIGDLQEQVLVRVVRSGSRFPEESLCRCVFVPLVGKEGFQEAP
jgi:protein-L-isoaspartate(D-aspartate) O-methyltransferase